MFFIAEKQQKTILKLSFKFIKRKRLIKTMEHQKILNLLSKARDSKFVTRKWNIVNDQSYPSYDVENKIIYNTEVLKSNPCDYNNASV